MKRTIDPNRVYSSTAPASPAEVQNVGHLRITKAMIETQKEREWDEKLLRFILNAIQTHDGTPIGKIVRDTGSLPYLNEAVVAELKVFIVQKFLEEEREAQAEQSHTPAPPAPPQPKKKTGLSVEGDDSDYDAPGYGSAGEYVPPTVASHPQSSPTEMPTQTAKKKRRRRRRRAKNINNNNQN